MLDISDGSLYETLTAAIQAKAMFSLHAMRDCFAIDGFMPDAEIEAEIAAIRFGE